MKRQVPAKKTAKKLTIFVGMSGGVDSSVSAALLKKAGHDVTGVFIHVWQPDWIECNWREERIEAMRAAAHLGIPFVTLDLEEEYKQGVIDYMIAEYAAGRTPNPDVMCNREVKFGAFWRWAREQGADGIATGHYARVGENAKLLKGVDENKDQSYFLWTLNHDDLGHVIFPVGDLTKPQVRTLAKKFKLPNAEKKDSQGLCFIGKVDVKQFLAHYTQDNPASKPGKVVDEKGEAIGTHPGALFFTIGERHGFTIDADHTTPESEPYYVIAKDMHANTVTVSNKNQDASLPGEKKEAVISRVSWVTNAPDIGRKIQARSRYRAELQEAILTSFHGSKNSTEGVGCVSFDHSQDTLTPGQSLVFYDGDECLGGGILS